MPVRKLLAYAAIYLLWSGSFLAIRELVSVDSAASIPPFFAAAFRFTVAGALLLLWTRFREPAPLHPRQLLSGAALGLMMFTCEYAGLFWAETRVTSGIAAVVSAMIPVWIFAGEIFLLRTLRATALALGGIAVGFVGILVLSLRPAASSSSAVAPPVSAPAILVVVAGSLCWSAGTLLSRRLPLPHPQKANAGWQMFSGGLFLFALSAATGELRRLPPAEILFSARIVLSMVYLIVAASIVSYSAYVWLIAHDSPTRVASYAYVNPVFALILGAVLAGERLTARQIAGAVLVLFGVFATLIAKQRAAPEKAQFPGLEPRGSEPKGSEPRVKP